MRAWVHYAVQDERALPGIREEGSRTGGARPLRGRVGGSIAFAARGSCWRTTRRARGRWVESSGPAGTVSGDVVGSAPGYTALSSVTSTLNCRIKP